MNEQPMDNQSPTPKQQVVERLRNANSVLVTVSQTPTAEEIAAAIGLSRLLHNFGKKVTTLISSQIPETLEFLGPKDVISNTIDRLRDFVIEIDKEKADKLRYKPEDEAVKIFITPYKTEITEKDLRFSQGDYNVDTVVVIGLVKKETLDKALVDHTRILHDAAVLGLSVGANESAMGSVSWHEPSASSVSELMVSIADALQSGLLDKTAAQALLSGIVIATDGFRNQSTTPKVMTIAAQLMASGADQQEIMKNLQKEEKKAEPKAVEKEGKKSEPEEEKAKPESKTDLVIEHEEKQAKGEKPKPAPKKKEVKKEPGAKTSSKATKEKSIPTPEAKPSLAQHTPSPAAKNADSALAADAIDNLIKSTKEITDQMDAGSHELLSDTPSNVPIMQHKKVSQSHNDPTSPPKDAQSVAHHGERTVKPLHDNTKPLSDTPPASLATPTSAPAPQPTVQQPQQVIQNTAVNNVQSQPEQNNGSLDMQKQHEDEIKAARQAVDLAVASHPETEMKEPIQALNSETLPNSGVQIEHNDTNTPQAQANNQNNTPQQPGTQS